MQRELTRWTPSFPFRELKRFSDDNWDRMDFSPTIDVRQEKDKGSKARGPYSKGIREGSFTRSVIFPMGVKTGVLD